MIIFKLPQLAWHGPKNFELSLPDKWRVEMCYMAGYQRLALQPQEIQAAIENPIGTKPLRELALGKKEVVVVFDDMSRVTRVAKIVPFVLQELAKAGVPDINIQFICGVGLHAALYRPDFIKKLGEDVVARFRCFNHNPFANCVDVGTTKTFQTKLIINPEYAKADLKIVIGSCVPHPNAGFGGGSKMIMPAISSFESILLNHKNMFSPGPKMGHPEDNIFKKDIDECAELAGIDFLVNTINGLWGDPVAVYAGDWKQAYAAAVKDARVHYRTPGISGKDIIITNAYAKANEASIALSAALPMIRTDSRTGSDIVVIANSPEGQVPHYLLGRWGKTTGGAMAMPGTRQYQPYLNQIISYSEYPHPGSSWWAEDPRIKYSSQWDEVINCLQKFHGGNTTVAILADATNQYFV